MLYLHVRAPKRGKHEEFCAMTVLIVMGVSGSGKTTIGQALARRLGYEFVEGDEFHSRANRQKMQAGLPLDDSDRAPWLEALRSRIAALIARGGNAVITCSALKRAYRNVLRLDGVQFVYLKVAEEVARQRLAQRRGHFFNPALLESQFETLEEPRRALVMDGNRSDLDLVNDIVERLDGADLIVFDSRTTESTHPSQRRRAH
jgi:gluconokinase